MNDSERDMIQIAPNGWANEAGAKYAEYLKSLSPQRDDLCEWAQIYDDKDIPCKFGRLHLCLCGAYRVDQVWLMYSPYRPVLEPIGQMSLFRPTVTHKRVWEHVTTGALVEGERPFAHVHPACKERAASLILLHEQCNPSEKGAMWRVKPVRKRGATAWLREQQDMHQGKIKPCVFDVVS